MDDSELVRVQVLLPSHQAYQVKQWAAAAHAKRNAQLEGLSRADLVLASVELMEGGTSLVEVELLPRMGDDGVWSCGWRLRFSDLVDEWCPWKASAPYVQWYRPPSTLSDSYATSCAEGAIGASVVLQQMKDGVGKGDARWRVLDCVQDTLRMRAKGWRQMPLSLDEPMLYPKQRCQVQGNTSKKPGQQNGRHKVVVIVSVCKTTRTCFAYEDRPITYKTGRHGRQVVDFDPRCIQTVYSWNELQPLES